MIIGVTGTNGAGKDTVIDFLKTQGFVSLSCSDIIREECKSRNIEVDRANLIKVGNELREKFGNGVLAERLMEKIREMNLNDVVINSIRHPEEVNCFKKSGDFSLLAVNAPLELRYERITKRGKGKEDEVSFEKFKEQEQILGSGSEQQVGAVMAFSDKHIDNDSSLVDLHKAVYKFVQQKRGVYRERPGWDRYFLDLGKEVAKRATCDRGRAGCVIVKDKRVLTTGYVGSPAGAPHCDEVGHQFRKTLMKDGSIKHNCVRTIHAEQNAISQAAKHGIPLDASTIYVKMEPCPVCAKMIVNAGIKRVVCEKRYHDAEETREIFKLAGVQLDVLDDEVESYGIQ